MKKIIIGTSILVAMSSSAFGGALATNTVSNSAAAIYTGQNQTSAEAATSPTIKLSNNVNAVVNFVPGTGVDLGKSSHYILFTKHASGSKLFATGDDTTNIYYKILPARAMVQTDTFTADTGAAFFDPANAWTSL